MTQFSATGLGSQEFVRRMSERAHDDAAPRRRSRIAQAWRVLWGEAVVPDDLYTEWAEYKLRFTALLKSLNAALARKAKAEKREQATILPPPTRAGSHKAALRSRIAEARGLHVHRVAINAGPAVAVLNEEEEP